MVCSVTATCRYLLHNKSRDALDALAYAYQAVAAEPLERAMWPNGLCGKEIDDAEAASPICRAEVDYQLKLIERLEAGESLF